MTEVIPSAAEPGDISQNEIPSPWRRASAGIVPGFTLVPLRGVFMIMATAPLSYHQQIRSPEWIRKAHQLKEEANWMCEHCHRKQGEITLTVHHTYYVSGRMLWEYPRCLLICLCQECHMERQTLEQKIYINVADVMRDKTNEELMSQPIFTMFNQ